MNSNPQYTSASLYVGDLHPDVSESFLYEMFREAGPVLSIRVCRDAVTRKSLGYAYVNFQNPTDAERALDTLNYTVVKAKPMRIMWSHRDPSVRKSGIGNIFIKNLDKSIDNKILYDTFSIFGNILSCKVATERIRVGTPEEKIISKGYGFVHYETQEAAEQAIAKVNNMELCDKIVYVGPFIRRAERIKQSGENQFFTNVYIKNLPDSFDTTKLTEMFAPFGTITKAVVVTDENGKSRQFGFANFAKPDEAKKAVEALNNTNIDGKNVYVGRAQKKQERQAMLKAKHEMLREERVNKYKGLNLYVRNLDETVDDAKLAEEFSQYGKINSATVMKNDKKISKGFGFVCFSTAEEATRAIKETNGKMFYGKPLYVALAQRKEERRAYLEAQYSQRITSMRPGVQPSLPGPVMYSSPVFYGQPGINIQQRAGFYPQQMVRQRAWLPTQPGQARNTFPMGGYVQHPHNVQRAPRPRGRGQSPNPQQANKPQQSQPPQQAGAQQGNRRGFKYNNTARNRPDQTIANPAIPGGQQMPAQMAAQPAMIAQEPLNPSFLAQASPEMRKQMLGERLYPLIHQHQPEHAAKITGMLLDAMDFGELLHLIESPAALAEKIQEALGVLMKAAAEGDAAPLE